MFMTVHQFAYTKSIIRKRTFNTIWIREKTSPMSSPTENRMKEWLSMLRTWPSSLWMAFFRTFNPIIWTCSCRDISDSLHMNSDHYRLGDGGSIWQALTSYHAITCILESERVIWKHLMQCMNIAQKNL